MGAARPSGRGRIRSTATGAGYLAYSNLLEDLQVSAGVRRRTFVERLTSPTFSIGTEWAGQEGATPVGRPWPEHQGRANAAPSPARVRAGHVVTEPTATMAFPVDLSILSARPTVERLMLDIGPPDAIGVRRATWAGRVAEVEVAGAIRELERCCGASCSDCVLAGDSHPTSEDWPHREDMSFGVELDLVSASLGTATSERTGDRCCAVTPWSSARPSLGSPSAAGPLLSRRGQRIRDARPAARVEPRAEHVARELVGLGAVHGAVLQHDADDDLRAAARREPDEP